MIQSEKRGKLYDLKRKVGPAARYYGEKTGKQFKTLIDHETNCIRVWRLE
ncbi:MAG: hypothetical protein JRF49_12385 [Deltaproteobacteria bacterium]|nr:hypothetical protein [Deltaproteobacteria bacterium]